MHAIRETAETAVVPGAPAGALGHASDRARAGSSRGALLTDRTGVGEDRRGPASGELEAVTAPGREAHPAVEVDLDLRYQSPAPALVGASEGADLLLLGRRGYGAPQG